MEELECPSTIEGDPQSGSPIQQPVLIVGLVEMVMESTVRHEFKNKESVVLVSTVAK